MCRVTFVAAACAALLGCGFGSAPPQTAKRVAVPPAAAASESLELAGGDLRVGPGVTHGNLTVFPVLSVTPRTEDRFVTLDEGLAAGSIVIREIGARPVVAAATLSNSDVAEAETPSDEYSLDGDVAFSVGEVNRLTVVNNTTKPLLLMPGEVIIGGSQDRTIAQEAVIAATGEPVPIDVYCVEHGRWRAYSESEAAARTAIDLSVDADDVAESSQAGAFVAKAGYANKRTRLAAQSQAGQARVWEEVATANRLSQVTTASGDFTANYTSDDVNQKLKPYVDAIQSEIAGQPQVVGVIVAINGKAESVDLFESTPLFTKVWPKLLKSYALDAVHASEADDADAASSRSDAVAFLNRLREEKPTDEKRTGGIVLTRHSSERLESFSIDNDGAPMGMGGGGFGGAIHSTGFAK